MSGKKKHEENGNRDRNLRDSAEDQLARRSDVSVKLSSKNPENLIHELRVHQIELEMQNEELRRAQAELDAARARYFDLYDLAPVGYCTVSEQGLILEANLTATTLLGVARGALVKQSLTRFILKEDQDSYYLHCKQLFESGEPQACELRLVKMDGAPVWVRLEATVAQDADGMPVCLAVMSDITKRKQVEKALLIKTMLLEAQSETSIDGILAVDNEGHSILFNKRFGELWKIPQHILDTKDDAVMLECVLKQLKDPDEFGRKVAYLYEHRAEQSREEIEFADGRYLDRYSSPLLSTDGQHLGRIWFFRDITERKRAEEEALRLHQNIEAIMDSMDALAYVADIETFELLFLNKYGRDNFPDFAPGKKCYEVLQTGQTSRCSFCTNDRLVDATGTPTGVYLWEFQNTKTGTWFECRDQVIHWHDGHLVRLEIAIDITERKRSEEELRQTLESLRKAVGVTIQVMASAVETRDPYTAGHQVRSANLARNIAAEMGLPQEKIDGIRMAGSIHDIGKLSIPAEILSKPTKLSEIEFSLIKEHARQGYEILRNVESPWPLAEIVYQHHERMDGSGYPRNLKGDYILIEARILAIADVVESMASHRPYRAGLGIEAALEEIEKNKGVFYDPDVVEACLRLFREKGYRLVEA